MKVTVDGIHDQIKDGDLVVNNNENPKSIVLVTDVREKTFDGFCLEGPPDEKGNFYCDYTIEDFTYFRGKIILEQ